MIKDRCASTPTLPNKPGAGGMEESLLDSTESALGFHGNEMYSIIFF